LVEEIGHSEVKSRQSRVKSKSRLLH
jgi:hypothetical protein